MEKLAVLFPGQGSQEKNMGRQLAESDKEIMDLWKKAEQVSGHPLREIYWDGEEADINNTLYLQPALTVCNISYWIKAENKNAYCTAGHSLGEYSALLAAEALSFSHCIELVSLRAQLMNNADPEKKGTMAAVLKLSMQQVKELVKEVEKESNEMLVVANYNTPEQFVCSGTQKAIALLQEKVKAQKGRAIALAVSGAFHSPMLSEAAQELEKLIKSLPATAWSKPKFPIYSNSSAQRADDIDQIKKELCKQMTSSVFWIDTIQNMYADGVRSFMESGPKTVLSKMLKPILQSTSQNSAEEDWKLICPSSQATA